MENLKLYEKVRHVPDEAKKTIKGGRISGMTDINPMWRIKTLTEQFGSCGIGWYYVTIKKWLETCGDEIAGFVDIELFIKVDGEWSKPIHGTGGSMFATKEKNGIHVSDECYKMATTDAISVACKQLGIGADVYWEADHTKYDTGRIIPQNTITEAQVNTLLGECGRTGIGWKQICRKYGVDALGKMVIDNFVDAMENFKNKPDKPIDPETIPPDSGLPFN